MFALAMGFFGPTISKSAPGVPTGPAKQAKSYIASYHPARIGHGDDDQLVDMLSWLSNWREHPL
ncbi:hypothetical protein [Sphingomonas sp.]|jgi:hypothetical protein|uniref:hypothetical protein n=1 Tax=Sphingomonas sp. TaxID=28214 RepID=UPI002EDB0C4A